MIVNFLTLLLVSGSSPYDEPETLNPKFPPGRLAITHPLPKRSLRKARRCVCSYAWSGQLSTSVDYNILLHRRSPGPYLVSLKNRETLNLEPDAAGGPGRRYVDQAMEAT